MKKAFTLICCALFCLNTVFVFAQEKTVNQKVSQGSARDPQLMIQTTNAKPATSTVYPLGFESGNEFRKLFESGGPYDYINPAAEILDKRDLTTKHFQTIDNKIISIASAGPVHYKKNGLWNTILNDVEPNNQFAGFGLANTHNRYQTYYGNSLQGGIKILTEQNEELNLMQDAGIVYLDKNFHETGNAGLFSGTVQHAQENFIAYQNLYNGVNAVIEHNAAGYELNYELQNLSSIQIPSGTAFVSFREGVAVPTGYHAVVAEDNKGIRIQNNAGRILLQYKLPVFYEKNDAFNNESRLNGNYFTEEKNGKIYLNVLVPVTWLTDVKRHFPLVIDPVVTVTPQIAFAWTFTVEEDAGCDYAADNDADDNMRVGFDDGTFDNDYYQCYANYDISSIPDVNCIQSAYVSFYEYNWNNARNDDNQLDFYFQAYDPIGTSPVTLTCDQNYADIDATGTVYRRYNVWGNCGGACTDFDETPNQWKNFPDNVGARVTAALTYNFVAFSLDKFNNSHSDPAFDFGCFCVPNNDEWIDFRGYSNTNRPQLVITHEAPYVAATSISGTTTICSGSSTTLSRVGGTTGGGGAWRWYTGSCGGTLVGSGDNITVSPVVATTYYLRGEGTCGNTGCVSVTVTVQSLSVAPTSISGTAVICSGSSTTLTQVGGTLGTGAVYNWYTASCGGTFVGSGASITVSPLVNTTYYVRAQGTCNTTGCASVTVTINSLSTAPGAITGTSIICNGQNTTLTVSGGSLGSGATWQWYTGSCGGTSAGAGASITVSPSSTTTYYVRAVGTCNTTTCVNLQVTVNQLSTAPASITSSPAVICNGNSSTLTVVGGSLGTGANWQWYSSSCGGTPVGSGNSITVSPISTTTFYVRAEGTCNTTGCASTTITVNQPSTDPFSISGTTTICNGTSTTLSVVGGSLGTGASWNWYTASCGGTFAGTGSSISVSPTTTTTYYVRAEGTCNNSNCVSTSVTVNQLSTTASSISGTSVICNGDNTTLSVVGGLLGTGANWQWYSGSCGGTSVGNGTSVSVSPTTTTTYFVRAEGTCNNTVCVQLTVTVNQPSVAPTSVSGLTTICNGISTTLTVVGGSLGTGGTWNWYSASCGGTAEGTGNSITVSPSSTTDYFVRAEGTCNTTSCAFTTVTVQDTSIPAASISAPPAICIGSSTNLSVVGGSLGTSATWEWYIGSCGGTHVGTGGVLSNVSPAITTTYFVRAEGLCNTTICTSFTLTVNPLPNGSLSGSTQVCAGVDTVLTFNFAVGTAPFDVIYTDGTNVFTKTSVNNGDTIRELAASTTTYSIQQITDANGCIRSSGFLGAATITVAPLPVISNISIANVLCNGGNTGSITLTASSGTPSFNYSIDNGANYQTGNSFSGLTAGTYFPLVSDALNCVSLSSNGVQVTEPQVLDHTNTVQNASCDNVFDGSITVNATGGTTPYSYSLNGGPTQLGNVFSGLLAGNYTVLLVDFNGCTDTTHVAIDTAYAVTASIVSQTDVSCFGGVDGTVTVQLVGGLPPYSYSINGVQFVSSPTFTGLASGNYLVTLRDSKGCTDFANVTIIQPNLLQAFVDSTHNILCNGDTTGAIYITVTGGNGGNNFVWSNGLTTEDITGIGAGTYNVAVTDSKGCSTSTGVTISQPAPLVVVLAGHADVSCNGGNNGSIDVNVFGGTPLYIYSWTNGATNEDLNALTIGTYAVTVTDANACTATFTTSIAEPTAITSSLTKTDVTCPGASNGSADLTVSGGVSPYTYLWSNGATSEDLSNVTGGTYTVIITDLNNCTAANSITINEGLPLTISGTVTNVLCNGGSTGAIVTTVSGGIPTYTYGWSNSATSPDLNNISAGNYSVTVSDVNSCSASATFVVTQPAGLVVSATTTDVGCAGGSNGSIDITVYGGVFAYTYNWSNTATTEDLHNISGGTYDVTITDANSCALTASYTINEPSAITSSTTHTDVSCHGADDATANLTVSGGTSPYTFFWSNFLASQNVTSLHGGLYYVVITDANGCEKRDSALIAEPLALQFDSVLTKDISCYNANDGAIHVYVSGGTQPYVYNWSDNTHADSLTALQNGTYAVTVIDAHNCTVTTSITIVNPSAITANFVANNPLCFGDANGSIDLIPTGGVPGYFYNWSNTATTEDISGLASGVYSVTITDSKGCTVTDSRTIVDPAPFLVSGIKKNITCHGYNNGSVLTSAYGGTTPYAYYWVDSVSGLNVSNGPFIDNLSGGNYFVTTTDANGCYAVSNYILIDPAQLTSHIDGVDATCFGTNTGSIKAMVLGGVRPYHYLWNNFAVDSFQLGIAAGHYVVQVIDTNGCFLYDSTNVNQPTEISVTGNTTNVLCYGDSTGSVTLTVSGGVPGYTFAWSNGTANQDLTTASAGTYTATVTDVNLCSKTNSFTLTQGVRIIPSLATLNPICHGGSTGSITAIVSGGVQPYSYAWSNAQSSVAIGALHAGGYSLTVTDAANCSVSDSTTLVDPAIIDVITNANASKCFNTATGSVVTNITGGTSPYTFLLNGVAQDSGTFAGLMPGNYLVLVTDVNGCQGNSNFTVATPGQISVHAVSVEQVILTGMETQLIATTTTDSNSTVLHYFWEPDTSVFDFRDCVDATNCNKPYVAPRTTTTFTVMVMSSDSCYASDTVTVQVLRQPSAFIPTAFTPNNDGLNDRFEFDILGATNIDIVIFNRWGSKVYSNSSQENKITGHSGWDGNVNGKLAPYDTYVYQMKVTYWDESITDFTGTVTLMK